MTGTWDRRLLLLRHAKAVAAQAGMSEAVDHSRALSQRGRADAAALGARLRADAHPDQAPDLVLVSTSLRTRETFELLGLGNIPRCLALDALYLASWAALLETLRECDGSDRRIMLIGHNPGLHDLALALAGRNPVLTQGFATCTLAAFDVAGDWSDLGPARARLSEVLHP